MQFLAGVRQGMILSREQSATRDAFTAPRFSTEHRVGSFNQPPPKLASLSIYQAAGDDTIEALKALGHQVEIAEPPMSHPVMLTIDRQTGCQPLTTATAPRRSRAGTRPSP